jgi:tRNA-Thr(GGU) m(6)t(6)A37 methyltransferase TsaA
LRERRQAPRQSSLAENVNAQLELYSADWLELALRDLESWSHLWIVFLFHLNTSWEPLVQPPRGTARRGVFATRSPHRPNPVGLSAVKLERREGHILHLSRVDILDGSPVLDIKPYVPYADALPEASSGWLESESADLYQVRYLELAEAQFALLNEASLAARDSDALVSAHGPVNPTNTTSFCAAAARALGAALREELSSVLSAGPEQPKYRRIQRNGTDYRIALKEWRAYFTVQDRQIIVLRIGSGYRAAERASNPDPRLDLHRQLEAFTEKLLERS